MLPDEAYDMVQMLDSMTFNHSLRVKEIAYIIETKLGIKNKVLSDAALVHDVGKLYIPSNIIDKAGRLDELERNIIDLHSYIGYMMLKEKEVEQQICEIVLYHHGSHMPCLTPINVTPSAETKEFAKMLHTIDMYEALTTDRPYRRGFEHDEALYIIEKEITNHNKEAFEIISSLGEFN